MSVEAVAAPRSAPATLRSAWYAVTILSIAYVLSYADRIIINLLARPIKADLGLSDTQFGLLVGTPILTGSLIRLALGIWTDQYGGRVVYTAVMVSAAIATWILSWAYDYPTFLLAALGVGIAGGSFAVGIAYTSAWFSKERQGTAMGIFGAGNAGSSLTKFIAPLIITASATASWRAVPQVYAVAMLVMAVLFWFLTSEDPLHRKDAAVRRRPSLGDGQLSRPRARVSNGAFSHTSDALSCIVGEL